MRILLDTNILLDALLIDRPQQNEAIRILRLAEQEKVAALVTPLAMGTVIFTLQRGTRREGPELERVRGVVRDLLKIVQLVQMEALHFQRSVNSSFLHIEDGVQYFSAAAGGKLDAIITRDNDFRDHVNVPVLTAGQFLNAFEPETSK